MCVELGVERPAGVLAEPGGDDPFRADDRDPPADPVAGVGVALDPLSQCCDGGVVGGEHLPARVRVAKGKQHRDRLGRGAGHVEAAYGRVVVAATQVLFRSPRVHAGHHGEEGVIRNLAHEAEPAAALTGPNAARFNRLQVVVRERLDVVGAGRVALERGYSYRHRPLTPESVHSSVLDVPEPERSFVVMADYAEKRLGA